MGIKGQKQERGMAISKPSHLHLLQRGTTRCYEEDKATCLLTEFRCYFFSAFVCFKCSDELLFMR